MQHARMLSLCLMLFLLQQVVLLRHACLRHLVRMPCFSHLQIQILQLQLQLHCYIELPLTTNPHHTSTVDTALKPHLKYPTSKEGWEEANIFFRTTLVPSVVAAPSPQEKNQVLVEGVYSFFANTLWHKEGLCGKEEVLSTS